MQWVADLLWFVLPQHTFTFGCNWKQNCFALVYVNSGKYSRYRQLLNEVTQLCKLYVFFSLLIIVLLFVYSCIMLLLNFHKCCQWIKIYILFQQKCMYMCCCFSCIKWQKKQSQTLSKWKWGPLHNSYLLLCKYLWRTLEAYEFTYDQLRYTYFCFSTLKIFSSQ